MISVRINGVNVKAKEGMTVLEAAQSADIYIPTLCSYVGTRHGVSLPPYGGCRLCIVEIEGMKGFPTACTTPAEDDMVVYTDTKPIRELRRQILELILSEHPYTCLVCERKERCEEYQGTIRKAGIPTGCEFCPKNEQCELQKIVEYIGIDKVDFPVSYRALPVEKEDPFYDRDYNLCILCGRCVRVCQDVRTNGTLAFTYRGPRSLVGTAFGKSHLESGCEFCGACVDVCPTGALSEKINKWEGKAERSVNTICPYCGVGCTLKLEVKDNRIIQSSPASDGINNGQACIRGRFCVSQVVHSPKRLRNPLVRKNLNFAEVSFDEALNLVADNLAKYKGKEFAFIASPQCTNEDNYIFKKFTQVVMNSASIGVASDIENIETPKNGECNLTGTFNMGFLPKNKILRSISKGEIKALYLTDNIHSKALEKLDFLVVQSVFPIPDIEFANVVLPAPSFAEVEGGFTNIRGESQLLHKAIEPLYNSRPDWWILCEIAKRLNAKGFDFKNPKEINSELRQFTAKGAGLAPPQKIDRATTRVALTPMEIKPSDGFYDYRGGSLIDEVKGMREVVNYWSKTVGRR